MDYRSRKVLLGVALTIGVVGTTVGGFRIFRIVDAVRIEPGEVHADGSHFGLGKVDTACLEEGLDRAKSCWLWDTRCETEAGLFTFGCLASARDTGTVCRALPKSDASLVPDIGLVSKEQMGLDGAGAVAEQCAARGMAGDGGCHSVYSRAITYCTVGQGLRSL